MCVSVGTTVLSATVLATLTVGSGMAAGLANVIAVLCGIGPSYVFNRRWVWGRRGPSSSICEVLPFWLLSLAGLAASTVAVDLVGRLTETWPTRARAVALPAANLSVFGLLWLVQFAVLERVVFRAREVSMPSRTARRLADSRR